MSGTGQSFRLKDEIEDFESPPKSGESHKPSVEEKGGHALNSTHIIEETLEGSIVNNSYYDMFLSPEKPKNPNLENDVSDNEPQFEDLSSVSEDEMEEPLSKRKKYIHRGKGAEWKELATYGCREEFNNSDVFSDLEERFNLHRNRPQKKQKVLEYLCKYSKKKVGFNCPVKVRVLLKLSGIIVVEKNCKDGEHEDHCHDQEPGERKNRHYDCEKEREMKAMIKLDIKSHNMKKNLKEKGMFSENSNAATKSLYNKTYQIKKELKMVQSKTNLDELVSIIDEKKILPTDTDQAYVVKSSVNVEDDGHPRFSVLMSTENLMNRNLRNNTSPWVLSVDCTYKTNVDDIPLLLFGRVTQDGKFHAIGYILTNHEDEKAIDFLSLFIKDQASLLPTSIMADAALSFTNSFKKNLPEVKRLMCHVHVFDKVSEKLKSVRALGPDVARDIYGDLLALQHAALDEESFRIFYALLRRKWTEEFKSSSSLLTTKIRDFFLYFTKQWCLSDVRFWFQGSNPQHALSNNSLEATNHILKKEYTNRERLSIPHLMDKISDQMRNWSEVPKESLPRKQDIKENTLKEGQTLFHKCLIVENKKTFIMQRPAGEDDRTMITQDQGVVCGKVSSLSIVPRIVSVMTTRQEFAELGTSVINRRNKLDYDNFDQIKDDLSKIAVVESVEVGGYQDHYCNCYNRKKPSGVKGKVCEHIVAVMLKKNEIPRENEPVPCSKGILPRGRVKKASKQRERKPL